MPVRENEYWKEGMDAKRLALRMKSKIWVILAAALAGALFAGAFYLILRQATKGEQQYRAEVLFSIGYDIREEDEVLKEFINEYNAYTWGDMMKSDRVVLPVMKALPGVERSVIEDSLGTEIASDPEFLNATFTTESEELSNQIAAAYKGSMMVFGETMHGRGLLGIEPWKTTTAYPVEPENRVLYAAELGAVIGLLAGLLLLAGWYVLDDAVLLEEDLRKKTGLPVFGYRTVKPDPYLEGQLDANLTHQGKKGGFREVSLAKLNDPAADFDALREAPVVILIEWNTACLRLLGHVLEILRLQDVEVLGFIITEADGRFLRQYYGKKERKEQA